MQNSVITLSRAFQQGPIVFVCPSIGFYEFPKKEFFPIILNAQDSSGCYKSQEFIGQPGKRKLLEEEEAEDGCLFHLTAVAAGALTTYLKYKPKTES